MVSRLPVESVNGYPGGQRGPKVLTEYKTTLDSGSGPEGATPTHATARTQITGYQFQSECRCNFHTYQCFWMSYTV